MRALHLCISPTLSSRTPLLHLQALHTFYTTTSPDSYKNASIRAFLEAMQAGKRGTECGHATDSQANCFCKVWRGTDEGGSPWAALVR